MSSMQDVTIRRADLREAAEIAPLMNAAGEGLPMHFWRRRAEPDQDGWDVARARLSGPESPIARSDAWVAVAQGRILSFLLGYSQPDTPDPIPADVPDMFRPLIELEAEAPGTFYINMLATVDDARGHGIGSRMLEHAEERRGPRGTSLIVSDTNADAIRLYHRHGYSETARRPMVKAGWDHPGRDWILMIKAAI